MLQVMSRMRVCRSAGIHGLVERELVKVHERHTTGSQAGRRIGRDVTCAGKLRADRERFLKLGAEVDIISRPWGAPEQGTSPGSVKLWRPGLDTSGSGSEGTRK